MTGLLQRTVERLRGGEAAAAISTDPHPVVIFGTGGSGTRVPQMLVERAGCFMGTHLNRPGDSLDIGHFLRRWLKRYLRRSGWIDEVAGGSSKARFPYPRAMADDFLATVEDHREAIGDPDAAWGWKAPRTIFVFPFVHELLPGMKAIHLVRDGRDMAYSRNDNQVAAYSPQLLDGSEQELPSPLRSILFWSRVNLAAARYGERNLGASYLRLRYEDLCADPRRAVAEMLDFLGSEAPREAMQEIAAEKIQAPSSIGRWRGRDESEIEALQRVGGEALREFGYE
jgi:hypothetical protein